jgi:hypothetical protein
MLPPVALLCLAAVEPATLEGAAVPARWQPVFGVLETTHVRNGLTFLLTAQAAVGVGGGFDVGAALDQTAAPFVGPGAMTAAHVTARKVLVESAPAPEHMRLRAALTADVSAAWFGGSPATQSVTDPRLWTGLRDYNGELGFALSGTTSFTWFVKAAVLLSIDKAPPSPGPLEGPPPPFNAGVAASLEGSTSLNVGWFHAIAGLRAMLHGRPEDERLTLLSFLGICLG